MKLNSNVLLLLLLISATSCISNRMQKSLDNALAGNGESQMQTEVIHAPICFEKTACFGRCPAFKFNWKEDNSLTLHLIRPFSDGPLASLELGHYSGQLSLEKAAQYAEAIHAAAEAAAYSSLQSEYDNPRVTDLPATITEIDGKRVRVRYGGPDLNNLYTALQTVLDETQWTEIE